MIPAKAVKTVGDINSVFIVKDGIAHEQFIKLGMLEGDLIQVKSGVIEGDRVIVTNLDKVRDGMPVVQ
jgi:hypothetical protein